MRKSMTYGTLPSREEFDAAFEAECPNGVFEFTNDRRVGTCELTASELWAELEKAQKEWTGEVGEGYVTVKPADDAAGQWCSDVLGILGFEWI